MNWILKKNQNLPLNSAAAGKFRVTKPYFRKPTLHTLSVVSRYEFLKFPDIQPRLPHSDRIHCKERWGNVLIERFVVTRQK